MIAINDYEKCRERWSEIIAFAKRHRLIPKLARTLDWLGRFNNPERRVVLFNDFAPLSMQFVIQRLVDGQWGRDYCGGLIYQGPLDEGEQHCNGSFPTLTVSLASGVGWFVHT